MFSLLSIHMYKHLCIYCVPHYTLDINGTIDHLIPVGPSDQPPSRYTQPFGNTISFMAQLLGPLMSNVLMYIFRH